MQEYIRDDVLGSQKAEWESKNCRQQCAEIGDCQRFHHRPQIKAETPAGRWRHHHKREIAEATQAIENAQQRKIEPVESEPDGSNQSYG